MRRLACMLSVFAVLGFLGTPFAMAKADKPKKSPEVRFKNLDKNGDEKLSLEEFLGKRSGDQKTKGEKQFSKRDKDGDGALTLEEFKTMPKKKSA